MHEFNLVNRILARMIPELTQLRGIAEFERFAVGWGFLTEGCSGSGGQSR
jgi:hypothetical protein